MNALNAYNKLNANVAGLKKASEKLSSGYRINRAGDDAAGLAISEKMRSQIRGLNQAKRNAQDGISMIQTFEGAAQETHTILQRMKELATESANGTYDNATDRAAIQLEFDQLNDELNQLADTDFNGTIVLNGGEMADGLKVSDLKDGHGEFNYNTGEFNYSSTGGVKGNDVTKYTKADNDADESAPKIVNNAEYNIDAAKALWKKLGLDSDTKDIKVTFVKNGDTWEAKAATTTVTKTEAANPATPATPTTTPAVDASIDTTGTKKGDGTALTVTVANQATLNGKVTADTVYTWDDGNGVWKKDGTTTTFNKASLQTELGITYTNSDITDGSTITIKGYKPATTTPATPGGGTPTTTTSEKDITASINLDGLNIKTEPVDGNTGKGGFKVSWVDEEGNSGYVDAIFNAHNSEDGDYLTINFTNPATPTYAPDSLGVMENTLKVKATINGAQKDLTSVPKDTIKITLNTANVNDEKMDEALAKALENLKDLEIKGNNKNTFTAATVGDAGGGQVKLETGGSIKYVTADGTTELELGKVEVDTDKISETWTAADDTFEFKLNVDGWAYGDGEEPKANSVETTEALKDIISSASGVSVSNAFKKSTAIMNYAENIILQTGSRTKDAVNFTFKYNTDKTADMGDLKANLNLSSRADGLNTANLSLANAEDANYAIDQIDKAINKTSMVRASFGAIQNRLDYKIENLTTTSENLTEAESNIRDTDMANEMLNYTKFNILQQAAQSMLAQANQQPQSILQLLG